MSFKICPKGNKKINYSGIINLVKKKEEKKISLYLERLQSEKLLNLSVTNMK
jgi:hypothetical protein